MIGFEEFVKEMRESVSSIIDNEVDVQSVKKNNGIELTALSIKDKNSDVVPLIYLNGYYHEFMEGRSVESITRTIIGIAKKKPGINESFIKSFLEYENLKDKIEMKLINKEKNKALLEETPYVEFLDLAIIFVVNLDLLEDGGRGSIILKDSLLEIWNIEKEELYEVAKENCNEYHKASIRTLSEAVREIFIEKEASSEDTNMEIDDLKALLEVMDEEESGLYVLTNDRNINGAVAMTYEGVIKDFANKLGSDIYILPSSIHEVLLIAATPEISKDNLQDMVSTINRNEVDEMETLSDNVYYYNREIETLTIA